MMKHIILTFCVVVDVVVRSQSPCAGDSSLYCAQGSQNACEGDTRGDRRCAHDATHRVCAEIGDADTSFFDFTGQTNWCGTVGHYGGPYGNLPRCPPEKPTWCICKWATARWIAGEGCNDSVNIDCDATDICATSQGLYFSYNDYDVNLHPARECAMQKCSEIWSACEMANSHQAEPEQGEFSDSTEIEASSSSLSSTETVVASVVGASVGVLLVVAVVVIAYKRLNKQAQFPTSA